jgi:riboflavin biosynthesis pyrimidine reductase
MRVSTNTAASADGKIGTVAFDHVAIGTPTDRRYMSVLRARADAVLVGGRTFRNWPLPLVPDEKAIAELRASGFPDCDHPPLEGRTWWTVVITRTGDVPPFKRPDPRAKLLVIAEKACEVPGELVVVEKITVPRILEVLAARGVEDLLVEAGGDLLFQFVEADVVDDVYLTICPLLIGGRDAPTPLDGRGFSAAEARRARLAHAHRVGDELYCRYTLR